MAGKADADGSAQPLIIATASEQAAQTKAATMNYVKSLAKQLAEKGIRALATLNPGSDRETRPYRAGLSSKPERFAPRSGCGRYHWRAVPCAQKASTAASAKKYFSRRREPRGAQEVLASTGPAKPLKGLVE
jgi:NAD(P)-dependent dehydrogenase (short-subunit alcohol dehydrogenase family)